MSLAAGAWEDTALTIASINLSDVPDRAERGILFFVWCLSDSTLMRDCVRGSWPRAVAGKGSFEGTNGRKFAHRAGDRDRSLSTFLASDTFDTVSAAKHAFRFVGSLPTDNFQMSDKCLSRAIWQGKAVSKEC